MVVTGPVLADTSVWVSFLRRGPALAPAFSKALEERRVVTVGPVVAELVQGVAAEARTEIEERLGAMPFVPLRRREWVIAGHVSGVLRGRGTPVNLVDVVIAAAARSAEIPVLTADRDFLKIAEVFGDLRVELVE